MSKLWKGVKKVFKKVGKFVKKYWKVIVVAAAVYFTAGVALSAMPSTASFASMMPGFGSTGMNAIFSKAAVSMGFQGATGSGIASVAGAANAAAITGAGVTTTGLGAAPTATTAATGATGTAIAGTATTGAIAPTVAPVAAAKTGILAKTGAAIKGMSGLEKVALASTIFQGVGGLLSDSQDDINKKQHNRQYGQSFGIGRDGTGPGWGGAVNNAFSGRFGGEEAPEGADSDTPFSASPPPQQGETPFTSMAQSEQQASRDKSVVGGGFKSQDYMPT